MPNIKSAYKRLLKAGELKPDKAQAAAIDALCVLDRRIRQSRNPLRRLFGGAGQVYGLYLWGPPGRGKSMMMDMFFEALTLQKKRRVRK